MYLRPVQSCAVPGVLLLLPTSLSANLQELESSGVLQLMLVLAAPLLMLECECVHRADVREAARGPSSNSSDSTFRVRAVPFSALCRAGYTHKHKLLLQQVCTDRRWE